MGHEGAVAAFDGRVGIKGLRRYLKHGALCFRLPLPPAVPPLFATPLLAWHRALMPNPFMVYLSHPQVVDPCDGRPLQLRVGIHSGPAVSGVVGRMRRQYSVFGDTVVSGVGRRLLAVGADAGARWPLLRRQHPAAIVAVATTGRSGPCCRWCMGALSRSHCYQHRGRNSHVSGGSQFVVLAVYVQAAH